MEVKAWAHQTQAIEMAPNLPGIGLFFWMGLGKTYTAIQILRRRMNTSKRVHRTLIFTKGTVVPQWREEWLKFTKIPPNKITLLLPGAPGKKRLAEFQKHAIGLDGAANGHIFITNYESLLMGDLYRAFISWGPEDIVFDESDEVKSKDAKRSKLAYDIANPWDQKTKKNLPKPFTQALTGTPILNSPLDIFQQVKIYFGGWPRREFFTSMGDARHLITNYFVFRAIYFRDRNVGMPKDRYFPNWQPMTVAQDGVDAMKEISEILSHISVAATKDVLDLPEEIAIVHRVGMTSEQKRVYEEMRKDLVAYWGDKACTADLAITKLMRLMQITAGFASFRGLGEEDDTADVIFKESPKDEMLRDLLTSITSHSKVLLWAVWKPNYPHLVAMCKELGVKYVEVHGGISGKQKDENVELFKTDPEVRVLIGNPRSGGIGLNLTQATYSIYYSRNRSLREYLQSRARNHRAGQTQKVTHYDLACQDTMDELCLEKLAQKQEIGASILGEVIAKLAIQ